MKHFLTLTLLLAACSAPTAPSDRDALLQARARWEALGSDSYTFELVRGCFCVVAGRVTVSVQHGVVVGAEYLDSRSAVEPVLLTYLPTVPDLFDLIADALDRGAASLLVSYDSSYGFPTRIEVDYSATAADDELSFTASDLRFAAPVSAP